MLMMLTSRLTLATIFPLALDLRCQNEPTPTMTPLIEQIEAGSDHTCVIAGEGERVRCWGANGQGQLGQGNAMDLGDDEEPALGTDVYLGKFGPVRKLAAGVQHTCVLSLEGNVRCWGLGLLLGAGTGDENIGDDEAVPIKDISLGFIGDSQVPHRAIDLAANLLRTCVVLDDNSVRCWGFNDEGELGLGFKSEPIGDDELASDAPLVPVGAPLRFIEAGGDHICGITSTPTVRCWGANGEGQLGYGHTHTIGDNDTPADAGDVDLGGDVIVQLALGGAHTCARTLEGKVRCWGLNVYGQLGYGHVANIGDDESPASAGHVEVDAKRSVVDIAVGAVHTCAVLDDGGVKCWGYGQEGQLGYGNKKFIGDNEAPASAPDVDVGAKVVRVTMGEHTCALLESGRARCWGLNYNGQLGYGHKSVIGDDEMPESAGDVLVF